MSVGGKRVGRYGHNSTSGREISCAHSRPVTRRAGPNRWMSQLRMRWSLASRYPISRRRAYQWHLGPGAREPLVAAMITAVIVAAIVVSISVRGPRASASQPLMTPVATGVGASPQVRVAVDLHDVHLHPRQLAYDRGRDGVWFWTSTQHAGASFDNQLYFYDIGRGQLSSWPLYDGDWSAQLLAGLAVAPSGDVWVGWNHNVIDFHPQTGVFDRYTLPSQARYPLPAAVLGDLPTDLGVSDLAVARDGTVWIARYGALSLTAFSPTARAFREVSLPPTAGDPAKLATGPDGHVFFITNFSADHPGYILERVGEYDPQKGATAVYAHGAQSLALTAQGDLYTVLSGHAFGLTRLSAGDRANAAAQRRTPVFVANIAPFDVEDTALAVDDKGRIWVAVAGQPDVALLDPATGQVRQFQYAAMRARVVHASAPPPLAGRQQSTSSQGQATGAAPLLIAPMAAMAADASGNLWYVRVGNDQIEEVTP